MDATLDHDCIRLFSGFVCLKSFLYRSKIRVTGRQETKKSLKGPRDQMNREYIGPHHPRAWIRAFQGGGKRYLPRLGPR